MSRSFSDETVGGDSGGEEETGSGIGLVSWSVVVVVGMVGWSGGVFGMGFEYTGGKRFVVGKVKDGCFTDIAG